MNNPVFPEGFDALLADASNPDPAGDLPAESKYQRKKKRHKQHAVTVADVEPVEGEFVPPDEVEPVRMSEPTVKPQEEYRPRITEPGPPIDNGLPDDGGQSDQAAALSGVDAPVEWLRVTLSASFGRRGMRPDNLLSGVVVPWSDPLSGEGHWRDCLLEFGIWRMARFVEPDGQAVARPIVEESTVMSVECSPFGFGGARTTQINAGCAVAGECLDTQRYPVSAEISKATADEARLAARDALRSIWPWFYLDAEEVTEAKKQAVKRIAGTDRCMRVVPVLPVCVMTQPVSPATALRLRSRLMDRVGHAALFVGLGDRMAPAGSPSVPLFVDLAFDQMPAVNAWLQVVIDTAYSLGD